jgi:sugar-specific transcriptional regulator TrmB
VSSIVQALSVVWQGDNVTIMPVSEKLVKELLPFGLTGNEAKVYLALLQLERANARAAARLSGIPRQEIYRVLPRLERLGMVEVIIGKPTKFLAIKPNEVLSELVERQKEKFAKQISELNAKEKTLVTELKKVEGKSAGLIRAEPVRFVLISGRHLVNEKIQEMLRNAKSEVLWMVPKVEIRRSVFYDRDKMLRQCAQRKVKVRIVTEVDKENIREVTKLGKFCDVRHAHGVTSLLTIVDNKELVIGSGVHTGEDFSSDELINKLWTNDSSIINVMKTFFEEVWNNSTPARQKIKATESQIVA